MLIEVKVPQLSESVSEATLLSWHKKEGEAVKRDENLVDVETDKVVLELPSPADGVIVKIAKGDGSLVTAQEIIATIDTEGKASGASVAPPASAVKPPPATVAPTPSTPSGDARQDPRLMPSARKLVEEQGVDPSKLTGSGRDGRITKGDVLGAAAKGPAAAPAARPSLPPTPAPVNVDKLLGGRPEQRVPMSRLRQRVAERLVQSQSTAAILTTFNEVNMQPVMDLRKKYQERFEKEHGVRLGFMSFFVKAATYALKKYPVVNASIDGTDIIYHGYFDIGVAVGSPRGLVVPVLRDADQLSFAEIEKKIGDFGKRAQEGKLTIEELTGGTFSISNGGTFGSMLSTPIINPPQSAILGIHATKERPVAENGQVVIRPMNYFAMSYDHRIIDGREAVLSLVAIKEALEDPARLLLDLSTMAQFDVVVIGAGPAGYIAAVRCAQLGMKVACVEEWKTPKGEGALGGTCLNVGCIPSKALLESSEQYEHALKGLPEHGITVTGAKVDLGKMLGRKDAIVGKMTKGIEFLFKKNKIEWLKGHGKFAGAGQPWKIDVGGEVSEAKYVILATGSRARHLPGVPVDNEIVCDNIGALAFSSVPERLGVIGAGVIGLELGSVWRRLGAKVKVLEALPSFLAAADESVAKEAWKIFTKEQGLDIELSASIGKVSASKKGVTIEYEHEGAKKKLECDRLVVSVGRVPNTDNLGAEAAGLKIDARGFIEVDDHCRTSLPGVFAIGDVVRGPMLAHKGEEEGVMVAEVIAGQQGHVDYNAIPWVIYTSPEIAWVGKTEQQLKAEGVPYRAGQFPFAANGRALGHGDTHGFVKMLAHEKSDEILGVHIINTHASELIAEAVVAMEFRASSEDIARIVHAHPSLSEVMHEAALAVDKRALNM